MKLAPAIARIDYEHPLPLFFLVRQSKRARQAKNCRVTIVI